MESKTEIVDNKQKLTSILFIPRIFKLLVMLFLIRLFGRRDILKNTRKRIIKKKRLQVEDTKETNITEGLVYFQKQILLGLTYHS